jgi:hypothetical protein
MEIHSSHLALRFYKGQGWTKEILEPYLLRGRLIDQLEGQEQRDYWWLDHRAGSQLDMKRLYEELSPRVFTYHWKNDGFEELTGEAAVEYMKGMNW